MARRQQAAAPSAADKERAGYDRDFYTWSQQQGRLVREGRWNEVDRENVAEEIESLGREQFNKLESVLRVLMKGPPTEGLTISKDESLIADRCSRVASPESRALNRESRLPNRARGASVRVPCRLNCGGKRKRRRGRRPVGIEIYESAVSRVP